MPKTADSDRRDNHCASTKRIEQIALTKLVPRADQPRQHYDPEALQTLADSLRQDGNTSPILVRPLDEGNFEILGGHRRHRAAHLAKLNTLTCLVVNIDDERARELVLIDNLHREDLLPWEEGRGYAELIQKHGLSVAGVAQRTGKDAGTVRNKLAVANAGEVLERLHINGEITEAALVGIVGLPNEILSPKRCPGCGGVCREDADQCPGCQADISTVLAFPAGNPQEAAAQLLRNKQNEAVKNIIQRVKASYGLARQVVQTSLGLNDLQVSAGAVEVGTKLGRLLEGIGKVGNYMMEHEPAVREHSQTQKAAIIDQCKAAHAVLRRVEEVCGKQVMAL